MSLTNAQTRDVEALLHPYTDLVRHRSVGPVIFERAQGIHIYDDKGKDYIEAMAGLWCTALGWGDGELVEAASEQMRKLSFGHLFAGRSHEPAIALAEKLKEIAPFKVSKVFFANSGSEANDTQIKLYWYANNALGRPNRKTIISREKAYHGVTLASASLTMLPANHRSFDLPFDFVRYAECPHYYRSASVDEDEVAFSERMAARLAELIERDGPEHIAAMIAEPLQGAGGVILPPRGYWERIGKVLERYGIPLIVDEVITGFGRTGKWFGSETYAMKPASMTIAKALSSAYLPISAVLLGDELAAAVEAESGRIGTFGHGFTYGGHPVACAVALKTIELYQTRDVIGHAARMSPHFQDRLHALCAHPLVGEVQGVGLIGALELVADKQSRMNFSSLHQVAATAAGFAQDEGVIVRPLMGDRLAVCPPLVIVEAEIDELFARLRRGLDRTLEWVRKEGLLGN